MTKSIFTSYAMLFSITVLLALASVMTTHASEVTGTITSDATSNSQTSGNISGTVPESGGSSGNLAGTVTGGSNGSNSSSGSRSSGSRGSGDSSSSNPPAGAVLGESTSMTQAPGFPNAGFAPRENLQSVTVWSTVVNFLKSLVTF